MGRKAAGSQLGQGRGRRSPGGRKQEKAGMWDFKVVPGYVQFFELTSPDERYVLDLKRKERKLARKGKSVARKVIWEGGKKI